MHKILSQEMGPKNLSATNNYVRARITDYCFFGKLNDRLLESRDCSSVANLSAYQCNFVFVLFELMVISLPIAIGFVVV